MFHAVSLRLITLLAAASLMAAACGDDGSGSAEPGDASTTTTTSSPAPDSTTSTSTTTSTTTVPVLPDPIPVPSASLTEITAAGDPWAQITSFDLSEVGYTQTEYTLGGTARSFVSETDFTENGRWTAAPSADEADYLTRVLVHRPADPADFNGTLIVEWFNVSGGLDAGPDWTYTHTELIREGYAWAGVSAQARGVEPSDTGLDVGFPLDLQSNNPERYGELDHPGDVYSYDIYTQAAQALLDGSGADPLAGLAVERTIAAGESQSASRLTTYINAIDPLTALFDGYFVHSRGGSSPPLVEDDDAPEMPDRVLIREDVRVPVLTFITETDTFRLDFLPARQPDTEMIRLWEAAGTAHVDTYTLVQTVGPVDRGDDPSVADVLVVAAPLPGIIECDSPINSGPHHWILKAAIHALNEWIITGEPPPEAPLLEVDDTGDAFVVDEFGNVVGGIRSPWVDAPVATLSGGGQSGDSFCGLFGTTVPLDVATLAELYPDNATYVAAVEASLGAAVDAGHIRPADAELIRQAAAASGIGG